MFKFGGDGQRASEAQMDYRIRFLDDHMKSYGNAVLTMPNTLFTPAQLESMVKGYGTESWKTDPQIDYIANKFGVDPLTVLECTIKSEWNGSVTS